jgi:hypothetical protein
MKHKLNILLMMVVWCYVELKFCHVSSPRTQCVPGELTHGRHVVTTTRGKSNMVTSKKLFPWLFPLADGCHCGYIAKLRKKKLLLPSAKVLSYYPNHQTVKMHQSQDPIHKEIPRNYTTI